MKRAPHCLADQRIVLPMNCEISLPEWAIDELQRLPRYLESIEDRMKAVIRFARLNFQNDTGGPFAAGVFEKVSGKIVVIGVNRVLPLKMSSAHAEIVALSLAQQQLQTNDLGGPGMLEYQLVVNAWPCAMCFGAIPWSGVRSLVVSATGKQVEEITGFDEGPVHPDWQRELRKRSIEVLEGILMQESSEVLREFATSGRQVYNGRQGIA